MKKIIIPICVILLVFMLIGYLIVNNKEVDENNDIEDITVNDDNLSNEITQTEIKSEESKKVENIKIRVNNEVLTVELEQNSATEALVEKLQQGNITVNTHVYGDFEQVGSLGFSLPTSDTQITTKAGDVMLYQGNQITLFYGRNSWSYTKLGEVTGEAKNRLKDIFGSGNATLVLSID